jgi:hypothetical protein
MSERSPYLAHLKRALVGDANARLVFVCNFEVETEWARGHTGLPTTGLSGSSLMVQRMEELGALLAGPDDVLLLKHPLDRQYCAHLEGIGVALPAVLVPEHVHHGRSTAEDMLDSPEALGRLTELGRRGAYLLPMGTSVHEQKLAEVAGLPLAVPDAAVFERVNSKVYGRRLTETAGLRCVPGVCCESVGELARHLQASQERIEQGHPVVVKDAFGVSGKGLVVLDTLAKAARLTAMLERSARRRGDEGIEVVIEEWLDKRFDLNYQISITRSGDVSLDFIKQALTDAGLHKGHLMPPDLAPALLAELAVAAKAIGDALSADGFWGIAGIDAILDAGGCLYPVLEINARLNMSTYQGRVVERFSSGTRGLPHALARHYTLRLPAACSFPAIAEAWGPLADPSNPGGFVVPTCFGTVNANAGNSVPFEGRLYAIAFGKDPSSVQSIDRQAEAALGDLRASPTS